MRKLYTITFLFMMNAAAIQGQTYRPLLDSVNIWHYSATPMTVRLQNPNTVASSPCAYPSFFFSSKMQYTTHDTIIDSLSYKIVEEVADQNLNYCEFGYVREDTASRKVFFIDNLGSPEVALYDFNMQVGDTITLDFHGNFGLYTTGVFQLDSVVSLQTVNGPTRLFCLNNSAVSFSPTLYWAEGIGCMANMFYPRGTNQYSSNPVFWQCRSYPQWSYEYLTCFDHDTKVYYDSCKYTSALNDICFLTTDTCDYYSICGSVENHAVDFTYELFPVPTTDCITLELKSSKGSNWALIITNVEGKTVFSQKSILFEADRTSFDVSFLAKGTYVLSLSNASGTSSKVLTIQ